MSLLAAAMGACAAPQLPFSDASVEIHDLFCNADQSVVATGSMRVPDSMFKLATEGALLHSADGGLTWKVTARGGKLTGITPYFFTDPRDTTEVHRPLVVTGYSVKDGFWSYPLGGWLESADSGSTWKSILPRLPAVRSQDPIGRPPPLAVADGSGRLVTISETSPAAVFISDDLGMTWSERHLPEFDSFFGTLFGLSTDSRGRVIVAGRTSSLLKDFPYGFRTVVLQSDDSGETWFAAMEEYAAAQCIPEMIGTPDGPMLINFWCPSDSRVFFYSADGGRKWEGRGPYNRYAFGPFLRVTVLDGQRLVAISIDSQSVVAWTSDNGGDHWQSHTTGLKIVSASHALRIGPIVNLPDGVLLAYITDATVLRSADRGESWEIIDTGLPHNGNYTLEASCTDGRKLVVLAGGQGVLIRSLDGGLTWERGQVP